MCGTLRSSLRIPDVDEEPYTSALSPWMSRGSSTVFKFSSIVHLIPERSGNYRMSLGIMRSRAR